MLHVRLKCIREEDDHIFWNLVLRKEIPSTHICQPSKMNTMCYYKNNVLNLCLLKQIANCRRGECGNKWAMCTFLTIKAFHVAKTRHQCPQWRLEPERNRHDTGLIMDSFLNWPIDCAFQEKVTNRHINYI